MLMVLLLFPILAAAASEPREGTNVKTLTPVLMVDEIEPVIAFWEALGFVKTIEVPEGDKLGFLGLESGAVTIMYQTRESVSNDAPELAETPMGATFLFITVEDLDSLNGTWLRGERIAKRQLASGDEVMLGNLKATISLIAGERADGQSGDPDSQRREPPAPPPASDIVLVDPAMQDLYRVVARVAKGDVAVLVLGETGTRNAPAPSASRGPVPRRAGTA